MRSIKLRILARHEPPLPLSLFPHNKVCNVKGPDSYLGTPITFERAFALAMEVLEWHSERVPAPIGTSGLESSEAHAQILALGLMAMLGSRDQVETFLGVGEAVQRAVVSLIRRYDTEAHRQSNSSRKDRRPEWYDDQAMMMEECGLYERPSVRQRPPNTG